MNRFARTAFSLLALTLAACGTSDLTDTAGGSSCTWNGTTYADGATWACDCNSCACMDGDVASTTMACGSGGMPGFGGQAVGGGSVVGGMGIGGGALGWTGGVAMGGFGNVPATGGVPPATGGLGTGGWDYPFGGTWSVGGSAGAPAGGAPAGGTGGEVVGGSAGAPAGGAVAGGEPNGGAGGGASCTVGDVVYANGETWPCDCNTCGCEDGLVWATSMFCGPLPCASDAQCLDDEYCAFAAGSCGGDGACTALPASCDTANVPVCGCNGSTYGNACRASLAGVSVDHAGDCGAAVACGGWAGDTCTDTEYCAYEPGAYCGGADAQSVCQPRPDFCTEEIALVCGCDGATYSNACFAHLAGTGVYSEGACPLLVD